MIDQAYIIDDDEITTFLAERLLKRVDFARETCSFTCASDAIDALRNAQAIGGKLPEVILFDLNMPGMNGWEFLQKFIALELPPIPLFVFSSSINPEDQQKADEYSAWVKGFITKPLTVEKLHKVMRLAGIDWLLTQ